MTVVSAGDNKINSLGEFHNSAITSTYWDIFITDWYGKLVENSGFKRITVSLEEIDNLFFFFIFFAFSFTFKNLLDRP